MYSHVFSIDNNLTVGGHGYRCRVLLSMCGGYYKAWQVNKKLHMCCICIQYLDTPKLGDTCWMCSRVGHVFW